MTETSDPCRIGLISSSPPSNSSSRPEPTGWTWLVRAGCWLLDRILLGAEDGFCDYEDSQDDAQDAQAPAVSLLGGSDRPVHPARADHGRRPHP
jgi:hypothetical protein